MKSLHNQTLKLLFGLLSLIQKKNILLYLNGVEMEANALETYLISITQSNSRLINK
jgi:NADH:ubiquinone oxidoreductase subunit K